MEVAHLLGRILLGGFFLMNAASHLFTQTETLTEYARGKGVEAPKAMVYIGGVLLLLGGLSLLTGVLPYWGIVLLLVFLVPVSVRMHAFWNQEGAAAQADRTNFIKNMALVGALLMMFAIPPPWPLALGG